MADRCRVRLIVFVVQTQRFQRGADTGRRFAQLSFNAFVADEVDQAFAQQRNFAQFEQFSAVCGSSGSLLIGPS